MSKHKHGPEFNHLRWICGICLLFDPLKECADTELSRDPGLPVQIADVEIPQPLERNLVHQVIPRVALLRLQAWILWLVDTLLHLFPVVA